jgi:hypothetical protein
VVKIDELSQNADFGGSAVSDDGAEMQFRQNLNAWTLLLFICALGCSHSPAQRPVVEAEPVWSVALSQHPLHSDTSSDFAATRRAVIVGNRVVVLVDLGQTAYVDGRPKSSYRLLSLDLASGAVLNHKTCQTLERLIFMQQMIIM